MEASRDAGMPLGVLLAKAANALPTCQAPGQADGQTALCLTLAVIDAGLSGHCRAGLPRNFPQAFPQRGVATELWQATMKEACDFSQASKISGGAEEN